MRIRTFIGTLPTLGPKSSKEVWDCLPVCGVYPFPRPLEVIDGLTRGSDVRSASFAMTLELIGDCLGMGGAADESLR